MKLHNKLIAVTGGAGFIGSHLVDRLLAADNKVLVVDDFSTGSLNNLAQHQADARLRVEQADIRDLGQLTKLFHGVDCVFHLACRNVRLSLRQPTVVHDVNTTGTLNVLQAAVACGVKRLLYCSSSEINGTAAVVPLPEECPYRPETIYGASKLAGEYYSLAFHRAGWLPVVVARPHNNYGPREHWAGICGEVIPRFIIKSMAGQPLTVYGDGGQTRDFTYVTETTDYLVRLLECDAALGSVYNVCRGQEVSIADIARRILALTGSASRLEHLPPRPSDVLRLWGDATRIAALLGSAPSLGIDEGLASTVAWFRANVPPTQDNLARMTATDWESVEPEPWLLGPAGATSAKGGQS